MLFSTKITSLQYTFCVQKLTVGQFCLSHEIKKLAKNNENYQIKLKI